MITERCRANNDSPDGTLILFLKEVQHHPGPTACECFVLFRGSYLLGREAAEQTTMHEKKNK
ncbi:MAG: hypothetical protein AABN95_22900, partial [Acidobacteriota bacterium]